MPEGAEGKAGWRQAPDPRVIHSLSTSLRCPYSWPSGLQAQMLSTLSQGYPQAPRFSTRTWVPSVAIYHLALKLSSWLYHWLPTAYPEHINRLIQTLWRPICWPDSNPRHLGSANVSHDSEVYKCVPRWQPQEHLCYVCCQQTHTSA